MLKKRSQLERLTIAESLLVSVMEELTEGNVENAPTVDAVPVIRCKDCKYSSPNQVYGCRIHSFADDIDKRLYADDFCSLAERREECSL